MTFGMTRTVNNGLKARWHELRRAGFSLDFDRAVFLEDVLSGYLHNDVETLRRYIVVELGEFAGKRVESFIRLVDALRVDDNAEHWRMLGGTGMSLLTRANGRDRRRVLKRLKLTLQRTGRKSVSEQTFRNTLRATLGEDGYQKLLVEPRSKGSRTNYRAQCVVYQQAILVLLQRGVLKKRQLPRELRDLLFPSDKRKVAA